MELENVLRRASAAPLGPLALAFTPLSASKWALTVTVGSRSYPIQAERDAATDGLILTCAINDNAPALHGAWVTDTVKEDSGKAIRLWLHGDGLTPALLLNALAALVPAAAPEPSPAEQTVVELPTIRIPQPPPDRPPPVPVERPRPVGWNSFGRAGASEPGGEPSSTADTPMPPGNGASESAGAEMAPDAVVDPPSEEAPVVEGTTTADVSLAPTAGEPGPPPEAATSSTDDEPKPAGAAGICRECGSPYEPDHAFCTNCGARLN